MIHNKFINKQLSVRFTILDQIFSVIKVGASAMWSIEDGEEEEQKPRWLFHLNNQVWHLRAGTSAGICCIRPSIDCIRINTPSFASPIRDDTSDNWIE